MRSEERMLGLMDHISDAMLEEALKVKRAGRAKKAFWGIAAAACLLALFMSFVPAGQVMAAQIRESIERLLEELFPPKEIPVYPEGEKLDITHEVYEELPKEGRELPKETGEALKKADKAGFAIYVDTDSYETAEEGDCHIIRGKRISYTREDAVRDNATLLKSLSEEEAEQKIQEIVEKQQEFYDNFPGGEIRIAQKPDISVEDAAEEMRKEMSERYANVSGITASDLPKGLFLSANEGTASEDEIKEAYFVDNGLGGVFIITVNYIVEATEGTGARFHSMIETFKVLEPSDQEESGFIMVGISMQGFLGEGRIKPFSLFFSPENFPKSRRQCP